MDSAFDPSEVLQTLSSALQSAPRLKIASGPRQFQLTLLRSQPRRTYSLFPWTANVPANKTYQEDFLLACSERLGPEQDYVPVYALEGCLFTLPATRAGLAYISKVDTTGLSPHPSPAKVLTAAFLSQLLAAASLQPDTSFRLHVFAKPATQYLFPGSAENAGKKQLEDKQLAKWWMRILANLEAPPASTPAPAQLHGHTLIPGLEWPEVRRLLAPMPPNWSVGLAMTPLVALPQGQTPALGDLIPCFPDDPKSRYMTSLTSSPLGPAGEKSDYDEQTKWLHHNNAGPHQVQEFETQRDKERSRLAATEKDAFLEGLAWRQECCAGGLVGFFVLSCEPAQSQSQASGERNETTPTKKGLSHHAYIKLWNSFHNTNYHLSQDDDATSSAEWRRLALTQAEWIKSVQAEAESEGAAVKEVSIEQGDQASEVGTSSIGDSSGGGGKRKAEDTAATPAAPNVMTLKPRKKVKPAPAPAPVPEPVKEE